MLVELAQLDLADLVEAVLVLNTIIKEMLELSISVEVAVADQRVVVFQPIQMEELVDLELLFFVIPIYTQSLLELD